MVEEKIKDCEKINGLGCSSFIYSIFISSFLGMATFNIYNVSAVDSYISVIIGALLGLFPLLCIIYIVKNSNGNDIIDLNIQIFGKIVGTIINITISILFILFASLILYNVSLFLDTQYIPDTSSLYVKILIMVAVVYASSKDIASISRVSQALFIINIILFLISCIGIITEFDYNNLLPILSDGIKPVLSGGIQYAIFGVFPLILLTAIPLKKVENKKSVFRNIWIIYILTNVVMFLIFFLTIGVLGYEVVSIYKYPEYMVLKIFSLFGIIERIENTLAIQFVFSMSICMILCIYICGRNVKKVFQKIKSHQLVPNILGILIIIISSNLFENSSYATYFIGKYIPYILGISFGSIILALSIGIFIKNRKKKKILLVVKSKIT